MEYIENFDMEQISIFLTNRELGPYLLNGKIEAFTATTKATVVKIATPKLSYLQTGKFEDTTTITKTEKETRIRSHSLSSFPIRKTGRRRASSLGDLSEQSTQMLLLDLTTTLNDSFPDYDFANSKLEQFTNREPAEVMGTVNGYFAELTVNNPQFLGKLWSSVDEVANLKRCEIFSFSPDISDDNLYENIWSLHYFFFNKDNKALIYLTCAASSKLRNNSVNYISDDEDDCCDFDDEMIESQSVDDDDLNRSTDNKMDLDTIAEDDDSADDFP
jgi:hypothetical protein